MMLIVDNNMDISGYPQGLMVCLALGAAGLSAKIKKPTELTEEDYETDKVILCGSTSYIRENKKWMKNEQLCISEWMQRKTPILGICFGGQLLAQHIFGDVITAMPVPVSGSVMFRRRKAPLFDGLPERFGVVTSHYEAFSVPDKHIIGEIDEWPSYAFFYPPNIWGLQFHPELMGFAGRGIVRLQRMVYDRHVYQDFSVRTQGGHGKRMLRNFTEHAPIRARLQVPSVAPQ
ncbi:MAG: hypothetical protein ABH879_05900 [archaeon]